MTPLTEPHLIDASFQSPVNAIARASGAPPVPELDESPPIVVQTEPPPDPQPPCVPERPAVVLMTEEEFEASERWKERQMEYGPLILISLLCALGYITMTVVPAAEEASGSAMAAVFGYLCGVAVSVALGVGAIFAVVKLFDADQGSLVSIALRCTLAHTLLDVLLLAIGHMFGELASMAAAAPILAVLLSWLFRLDLVQLGVVMIVHLLARVIVMGLVLAAILEHATT